MKKIFALILAFLLIGACCASVAFAQTDETDVVEQNSPAYTVNERLSTENFVQQLCALNGKIKDDEPTAKEAVRDFLLANFRFALGEEGTSAYMANSVVQKSNFSNGVISGFNIVAKIDAPDTDKQIVIGAHYDAEGQGANDNACGVAVLYETMFRLYAERANLPFDVVFVAFDREEDGLVGSDEYVDDIKEDGDTENILVMFNVDSIALGSNLYVMCENKKTDLADLILSQNELLAEKPYAKGVEQGVDVFGYGYYEEVQGSDHTYFRLANIPTALFFSGNYDVLGYVDDSYVINTSSDTFENMQDADFVSRIQTVSDVIVRTVTDENFASVAQNARKQLVNLSLCFNDWWPKIVVAVILVALAVLTWLYNRKLQKQALLGNAEAKGGNVFDKPDSEDIFSFGDGAKKSQNDGTDVDDIFTFKK